MSSKNNALLQDPEALFRTRIADPKMVARIEKLDSNKIAASAVMACFLGREGEITGLAMTPTREWESGIQAGRIGYYSRDWELPALKKCLKKKDTATARKHAARGIMFHMAAEGANAQLEQDESWASGSLELWDMDVCEGYAESPCWPDLNPDLYAAGVGASARLASLVYPRSNGWVAEISLEANELYTQACEWIDELFTDKRVWKAVQRLAKELVRRGFIYNEEMVSIIDGKDKTLTYLEQLAASDKWRQRLEPLPPSMSDPKNGRKPMGRVKNGVKPGNN